MKRALIVAVIMALVMAALLILFMLMNGLQSSEPQGAIIHMDCQEFSDQVRVNLGVGDLIMEFELLDPGDTLILEAEVSDVHYNEGANHTTIALNGCSPHLYGLWLDGDETGSYGTADVIEATLHVILVNESRGAYAYRCESIEESWMIGGFYPCDIAYVKVSPDAVRRVSSGECKVGITILYGLNPDGTHWMLQMIQVPTGKLHNATFLTILNETGGEALPPEPFSSIADGGANGVIFLQVDAETTAVERGDILLIDLSIYPEGYSYQITDYCGVLAEGVLQF